MNQKPRKSDFGEKKIHRVHASDRPRSLRLRRSFWKTVSIYPRSAPDMCCIFHSYSIFMALECSAGINYMEKTPPDTDCGHLDLKIGFNAE